MTGKPRIPPMHSRIFYSVCVYYSFKCLCMIVQLLKLKRTKNSLMGSVLLKFIMIYVQDLSYALINYKPLECTTNSTFIYVFCFFPVNVYSLKVHFFKHVFIRSAFCFHLWLVKVMQLMTCVYKLHIWFYTL